MAKSGLQGLAKSLQKPPITALDFLLVIFLPKNWDNGLDGLNELGIKSVEEPLNFRFQILVLRTSYLPLMLQHTFV